MLPLANQRSLRRGAVSEGEWSDWRWQLRNRLTGLSELSQFVRLSDDERRGIALAPGLFRIGVTPYYAELMDAERADCPASTAIRWARMDCRRRRRSCTATPTACSCWRSIAARSTAATATGGAWWGRTTA
jgi:hypothetical protein